MESMGAEWTSSVTQEGQQDANSGLPSAERKSITLWADGLVVGRIDGRMESGRWQQVGRTDK